jgi:hypothetical protein
MKQTFFWCALLTLLVGCGCSVTTANFTPLNAAPHELAARSPEQVEVYSSAPPDRPHVDIGLVVVEEGEVGANTPAELIWLLRQTAAQRGCDAIVLSPPGSKSETPLLSDYTHSFKVYSATCVVYRKTPQTSTSPPDES